MWYLLCCWADHTAKTAGPFLVWDVQIQNCYHGARFPYYGAFSPISLGSGEGHYVCVAILSFWLEPLPGRFQVLFSTKRSLLQDFKMRFHRLQPFFPNDIEPPLDLTAGSTHMKMESFPTPHVFTYFLNSTQPPGIAFAEPCSPLLTILRLPLHTVPPIMKWPASFLALQAASLLVVAGYSLRAAPVTLGCLSLIDPSSHLRSLLHFFLTSTS